MSGYLRLFLAMCVFKAHALEIYAIENLSLLNYHPRGKYLFLSGVEAVQCFYVFSGFFMAMVLQHKYSHGNLRGFYLSRFLRIFPAYWAMLLIVLFTIVTSGLVLTRESALSLAQWQEQWLSFDITAKLLLASSNFFIFGQDFLWMVGIQQGALHWAPFMEPGHNGSSYSLNAPAFSLAIELCFYLIAPFVICSLKRTRILFLAGLIYYAWLDYSGAMTVAYNYYLLPSNLLFFALGAQAFFMQQLRSQKKSIRLEMALTWLVVIAALFLTINSIFLTCMMIVLLMTYVGWFSEESKPSEFAGDLSYLIYIVHYPVMLYLSHYLLGYYSEIITLITCLLIYWGVERPKKRLKRQWMARISAGNSPSARSAAACN